MINLSDKVLLITGASKGIGYSLAKKAIEEGAMVYGTSRDVSNFQKSDLKDYKSFIGLELDLASLNSINCFKDYLISHNIDIDILINNAGVALFKSFNDMSYTEIAQVADLNFKNTVLLTNIILNMMLKRKSGVIVNILSGAIERNFPLSTVYSGTKAAIRAMSRSLREEVRDKNIKIMDVLPGATSTDIWDIQMLNQYSERMINPKDLAEIIVSNIQLSFLPNIMIEDIIVKPQLGDL